MIGRLKNGKLIPCPKQGRDGRGGLHMDLPRYYRNHPQRAAEDGWYPVRYVKRPPGDRAMGWTLRDGEIVQIWTVPAAQPETDDPILERLDRIEDCLLCIRNSISA